jgi:hypothetical protein
MATFFLDFTDFDLLCGAVIHDKYPILMASGYS